MLRRQSTPHTFEDQIAAEKARIEAQVAKLPPGPQKDGLLKKLRQLETASHISRFNSDRPPSRRIAYSCQVPSPHWHLNKRTVSPVRESTITRTSASFSPQRQVWLDWSSTTATFSAQNISLGSVDAQRGRRHFQSRTVVLKPLHGLIGDR